MWHGGKTNPHWVARVLVELTDNHNNTSAYDIVQEIISEFGGQYLRFVSDMSPQELVETYNSVDNNILVLLSSRGWVSDESSELRHSRERVQG